jgi:iron complex outermembrane receptor protein
MFARAANLIASALAEFDRKAARRTNRVCSIRAGLIEIDLGQLVLSVLLGGRVQHRRLLVAFSLVLVSRSIVSAQAAPPAPAPAPKPAPAPTPAAPAPAPPTPPPSAAEPAPPESAVPGLNPSAPELAPAFEPEAAPEPAPIEVIAAEPAGAPRETHDEEMLVTGSRIKRSVSLAKSAPVEILDRKALERSGATNAADIVQQLTAAQGSGFQGGGNLGNQGGGAYGTASINLRGLGAGATLTLINGRRMVPSAGGITESFGDISVIPLSAIERIEILKGGGSAIYGADAIGGVVNIITRPAWNGARVELDGQGTTRVDQGDATVSGAFGAKSERSRVMVALSYFRRGQLTADKRGFSQRADVDQSGQPGTFIPLRMPFDPSDPTRRQWVDPACARVPGSTVVNQMTNGMPTSDQVCTFNYAQSYGLVNGQERANVFASASYDLTSHTSAFSELQVSRARSDLIQPPSFTITPPLPVIPANHVDNPFGSDLLFYGRALGAAAGAQHVKISDDTYRVVAGIRGDFEQVAADTLFASWDWELSASWGISRYLSLTPDTLRDPFNKAINSCSDPTNLSGCFNPFYSAIDGTGTPNSKAVIDGFSGTLTNISQHTLQNYNAGMSGTLFKLPGGDVGIAFGGEARHEMKTSQEDHDSTQQAFVFFLGNTDARAQRDVFSGYLELRWPLYKGIELQTAVRVERYTDIERTTPSPFAGLTFAPGEVMGIDNAPKWLRRLQFAGQVTSAFRAPALYQSYPGFATVPTLINTQPIASFLPVRNLGNPSLKPERALIVTAGLTWQPIDEIALMSDCWTYDYRDRIAVAPAEQAFENDLALMAMGGSDPRVIRDATGALQRIEVKQYNIPGHVTTSGLDFGGTLTLSGANFGGSRDSWGAISLGAQGTFTASFKYPIEQAAGRLIPNTQPAVSLPTLHCDAKSCQAVGSRNYQNFAPPLPRWRLNIPLGWNFRGHTASIIAHYLSGLEDDDDVDANGNVGHLKAIVTFDAQYGYTIKDWIGKELSFRIGFYNIFDVLPPPTKDINGFEALLYDPRGRMVYAKMSGAF